MKRIISFIVISFFALVTTVNAAEPADYSFEEVATVLVRSARVSAVIDGGPTAIEDQMRIGEPHNTLAKAKMVPLGMRIPEPPVFYFGYWGIDEDNNVLVGFDMLADYPVVSPVRIFVDNLRASHDIEAQKLHGTGAGTIGITSGSMSEIHNVAIRLPGKLGTYWIKPEVDFVEGYYFAADYYQTVEPTGSLLHVCRSKETFKMLFVFNVFNGKFPSAPSISVNARGLISIEPPTIERHGFFDFLTLVISGKDYDALLSDGDSGWLFVLNGGPGETGVQFYDWVPSFEEIPNCPESSTGSSKRRATR